MKNPKQWIKQIAALEVFIEQNIESDPNPDEVKVYAFVDHGIRIAEVSLVWKRKGGGMSGNSYMRCDCPSMILACEQFLLTYGEKPFRPDGWDSDIDYHADAEYQVERYLNEKTTQPKTKKDKTK